MTSATAILADPVYKEHWTGEGHPERPARFDAVLHALEREGFVKDALRIPARPATEDEIALCHGRKYIEIARRDVSHGPGVLSTGDTEIGPRSLEVAMKAAGGVLNAVDTVFARKAKNAFCAVRPPGHHATPDRGMGFCLFNNAAIAARYAQKKYGIDRALIVDWDVHHGNGTQDIFYADPRVFYVSMHQFPLYPGSGRLFERGAGLAEGTTMNLPFPPGTTGDAYLAAIDRVVLPVMELFGPTWLIISAGFDAHVRDPLTDLALTSGDFARMTARLCALVPPGRRLAVLEGGYDLQALESSSAVVLSVLAGEVTEPDEPATSGGPGLRVVDAAIEMWQPL
jgi:acetoin utilization deacetylase AcuC-like enzyme